MSVIVHKAVRFRPVYEVGKINLGTSIEAHTQSGFNCLKTSRSSIGEVLIGVVAIHKHLT